MPWTTRFRFRISTPLTSDLEAITATIGDRAVIITGEPGKALRQSFWLTVNAHDLATKEQAEEYGRVLTLALIHAAAKRNIGIDRGEDRATSGFGKALIDMWEQQGHRALPNVHGLMVYKRQGNEFFPGMSGTGIVSTDPGMFLGEVDSCFAKGPDAGSPEQIALELTSRSKMAQEPLSEAAQCISAAELLSVSPWTEEQLRLLTELREQAATTTQLAAEEAQEVVRALGQVFKSIGQGVRRKMRDLGFSRGDLKAWDDVYDLRSGIIHGSITDPVKQRELQAQARDICTRIVLAAVEQARQRRTTT